MTYDNKLAKDTTSVQITKGGNILSFSRGNDHHEWTDPVGIRREKVKFADGKCFQSA
jgi:hypothetical protein